MYVINQDKNQLVIYDRRTSILSYVPVIYKNILIGFNLLIDGNNVGTFDSGYEVTQEIFAIMDCKEDYYSISGFSDWDSLVEDWRDDEIN